MGSLSESWSARYRENNTGWDIGYVSTPLKEYIDQLTNRDLRILIPGAGYGWEAAYLFNKGFKNVFYLDFASDAMQAFREKNPDFPADQILSEDFFEHQGRYDLILEQTFFCSFDRQLRPDYAVKCHELLAEKGKLVGLLFNHEFDFDHQPFGGSVEEYLQLFKPHFEIRVFETAHNSIKPRRGREVFMILEKSTFDLSG